PSAIASCASVSSMPISFSAVCIISLVMRGVGVGEGLGVCASASIGSFVAARPAAPMAGSSFTKARRVVLVFLIFLTTDYTDERQIYLFMGSIVPVPTPCVLDFPYFSFTT